jgi:AcrR family transcriptional regulator
MDGRRDTSSVVLAVNHRSKGRAATEGTDSEQESTVHAVLVAARYLFHSPGYASTPVSDIARLAGVSRATVYNHFSDKSSILNQLVRDYMTGYEKIAIHLRSFIDPEESIYELLHKMVRDAMLWRIENADLRPAVEVAMQMPDSGWREADEAADRAMYDWLASIHHAARSRGITRPDIDIDFATGALYSMIEASLSTLNPAATTEEVEMITDQLTLLQWHAIYTIAPDKSPLAEDVLPSLLK